MSKQFSKIGILLHGGPDEVDSILEHDELTNAELRAALQNAFRRIDRLERESMNDQM
jgi:hypothetical protein